MSTHSPLERLNASVPHTFRIPTKLINEGSDLPKFLVSRGYHDILSFLGHLNRSMFPLKSESGPIVFGLDQNRNGFKESISKLRDFISILDEVVSETPPDPGPRRFGNISFRKWYNVLETKSEALLEAHLPNSVISFKQSNGVKPVDELRSYLLGGFGSAQRLDYGTGHELSFIAFLAGTWKLGGFAEADPSDMQREIVLGIIHPYLALVRRLILTYNLEPAGTHGVWGLDDHSFVPYIFGSAQYGPSISDSEPTPTEGSLPGAPNPGDIVKIEKVRSLRETNMYFDAIGFIYDVKKGPFWEHSPTLYDISGVKAGWAKINKGMLKMYNAEVLSKFPVVQHFPFGSLFEWDRSPAASDHIPDIHSKSQPLSQGAGTAGNEVPGPIDVTSTMQGAQAGLTRAPWAQQSSDNASALSRAPPQTIIHGGAAPATQAPWARQSASPLQASSLPARSGRLQSTREDQDESTIPTKAPWAK